MVSLVCAWVCAHETHGEMAAAHHHYAGMRMPDESVAAQAICRHDFGTVQLFSPSAERQAPVPAVQVVASTVAVHEVLGLPFGPRYAADSSPPGDSALSPPRHSPVLRI